MAFGLVLAHQYFEHTVLYFLPKWHHFGSQLLFYGLIGPILAWWVLGYIQQQVTETESALDALQTAHTELGETSKRLEFLIQVNHRLASAQDEEELISTMLELPQEIVPLVGSSFIRFDGSGEPANAYHHGDLTPDCFEQWARHISGNEQGKVCEHCGSQFTDGAAGCPIALEIDPKSTVTQVTTLKLAWGERLFGLFIMYLRETDPLSLEQKALLKALASELSLTFESVYLRSRQISMLSQINTTRQTDNLYDEIKHVVENSLEALNAYGGVLTILDQPEGLPDYSVQIGRQVQSNQDQELLEGLILGLSRSNSAVIVKELEQKVGPHAQFRSLIVVPLRFDDDLWGGIALWSSKKNTFSKRHTQLLEALAGHMTLLIENHQLYLQASYQAALAERARLSREIHDGLAQTLGYLKLRTSQILKWLDLGDQQGAANALNEVHDSLAEAYLDAREAIEGLRLKLSSTDGEDWLSQVVSEFRSQNNVSITINQPIDVDLPPEVQSQLQRIVQEALSNIRKHSKASSADLEWETRGQFFALRITDNGIGFEPDEVPSIARHGLSIMRERVELLDGEFQVTSRKGQGTLITVRLPLKENVA